ncbi:MAG TPA: rod shape-determining protein MreC, partial [Thermoanaerobaculia bacterium]|nr:rod shape-determining protein MreC [Thermoanaerobaculia bacterium]
LITDRAASVGVMIERTRRQGMAEGNGSATLDLSYIPLSADVRVGDRVITAGNDGIYPAGLVVGTVKSVAPGGDLFHRVELTPAVDFSRLVQVYVLAHQAVPAAIKEAVPDADR